MRGPINCRYCEIVVYDDSSITLGVCQLCWEERVAVRLDGCRPWAKRGVRKALRGERLQKLWSWEVE